MRKRKSGSVPVVCIRSDGCFHVIHLEHSATDSIVSREFVGNSFQEMAVSFSYVYIISGY